MERTYWLSRKNASMEMAKAATSSEARLVHYQLAARYDIKAELAEAQSIYLAQAVPPSILITHPTSASEEAGNV